MTKRLTAAEVRATKVKRRLWEKRITALELAKVKAEEDWLIAIAEGGEDGLTNYDLAYVIGNVHSTTAGSYRRLGEQARDRRRNSDSVESGE